MFYTSIVLFFGFLVFTVSSFGGTIALGGLVSITLLFAMVSNLLLLPSLLLSFENKIANKKVFKEPSIKIIPQEDQEKRFRLKELQGIYIFIGHFTSKKYIC